MQGLQIGGTRVLALAVSLGIASLWAAGAVAQTVTPPAPTAAVEGRVIPDHAKVKKPKCKKGQVYRKKVKKCVAKKKAKKKAPAMKK